MSETLTLGSLLAVMVNHFTKVPTLDTLAESIFEFRTKQDALRVVAADHLYITDFVNPCLRRLAYRLLRPDIKDIPRNGKELLDMDSGSAIHAWYQNKIFGPMRVLKGGWICNRCGCREEGLMPSTSCSGVVKVVDILDGSLKETACKDLKMGWEFEETHLTLNFHQIIVTGRPDGIITGSEDMLLEIKSTEEERFMEISRPYPTHELQAHVYGTKMGLKKAVILYVNRNHWWDVKTYITTVDSAALGVIEGHCESLRLILDAEDPMRASAKCSNRSSYRAKRCGCRDICFPKKRR